MGIVDVAHARIMVNANGDRNLRHDGVFVHLLFKRAGKFKMKAGFRLYLARTCPCLGWFYWVYEFFVVPPCSAFGFVRLPSGSQQSNLRVAIPWCDFKRTWFTLWDQSKSSIEFFAETKIFKSYQQKQHGVLHSKAWMKKTHALQVTSAPFTGRRRNKNPLEHPSMSTTWTGHWVSNFMPLRPFNKRRGSCHAWFFRTPFGGFVAGWIHKVASFVQMGWSHFVST